MYNITVSVVYAKPEKQWLVELEVPRGTQAFELVELSGIKANIPEIKDIDSSQLQLGVFSNKISVEYLMQQGDRLEIYRPLTADPKEVRRQLAKVGKTMGKSK